MKPPECERQTCSPIPVLLMARELSGMGGIERDVSKFARHLPRYGIAPHVACFRPGGSRWREIESAGIPLLPLPITSFKSRAALAGARRLRRYLGEHGIQVVHAFDPGANLFGVPLARLFGVPVVLSSQLWLCGLVSRSMRGLLAIQNRLATGVFVNCQATADELTSAWKIPARRIHVCHNGLEGEEFHARNRTRPPRLAGAGVVIGAVAALRPEKNLSLLVEAFARVRAVDPRAVLLIVGDGDMKPLLQQQARALHLGDSCLFEPATPKPADWMRAIDVFVLPSNSEAFSNALLEAMACGCCPVGSRVGGTPELIRHGERGLLFESGNGQELAEALCRLTLDAALRQRLAAAATAFAHESLNIEVASARLAAIYKSLLQQSGARVRIPATCF